MASVASSLNSWNDSKVIEYYGEYETWLVDIPSFLYHTDLPNYDSMFYGIFDSLVLSINSTGVTVYDSLVILDAILSAIFGTPGPVGDNFTLVDIPKMIMGSEISVGSQFTWLDEIYAGLPSTSADKSDSMSFIDSAVAGLLSIVVINVDDSISQDDSVESPFMATSEVGYIRRYLNDVIGGM